MSVKIIVASICGFFLVSCASSDTVTADREISFSYSKLKLWDLDQMSELLQQKVKQFKKTNTLLPLEQGLEICLSRPDEDSLVEKTISIIKNPLDDNNAWESTVETLVDKSINRIKSNGVHPSDQVTAGVVLENIISEFKPDFSKQYESPGFETRIIERIAAAELEFSRAAAKERKLNLMRTSLSPSGIAERLIEQRNEFLAQKLKKQK